ncbi:Gp37Gp68 family protein, partial [Paramagnetospirillum caucaseum]
MVFPSLCDIFDSHPSIKPEWRDEFWNVVRWTPNLIWQILTKRPENFANLLPPDWGKGYPNVWLGVTAENQQTAERRIPLLLATPAAVHWVSIEPLVSAIEVDLAGIDWVVVGGESGRKARQMNPDWVRSLQSRCMATDIPFFFKQWGEFDQSGTRVGTKSSGDLLDGTTFHAFPACYTSALVAHNQPKLGAEDKDEEPNPKPPTGDGKPSKDPKRVAAAHRAWATMRA